MLPNYLELCLRQKRGTSQTSPSLSLSLSLKQRRFVINRVILPKGVKGATYVVLTGHRSNTHETQGHGSHTSNLPTCQHIDIVRQQRVYRSPIIIRGRGDQVWSRLLTLLISLYLKWTLLHFVGFLLQISFWVIFFFTWFLFHICASCVNVYEATHHRTCWNSGLWGIFKRLEPLSSSRRENPQPCASIQ